MAELCGRKVETSEPSEVDGAWLRRELEGVLRVGAEAEGEAAGKGGSGNGGVGEREGGELFLFTPLIYTTSGDNQAQQEGKSDQVQQTANFEVYFQKNPFLFEEII